MEEMDRASEKTTTILDFFGILLYNTSIRMEAKLGQSGTGNPVSLFVSGGISVYDVLIIGCGITGAAAAFMLSKYRLKIGILEQENDIAQGATKANSAILHAGYDPEPGTLMAKLNVRGSVLAGELCEQLDVPYRRCGSMVLAFSREEEGSLKTLLTRGEKNGVRGLRILTGDEAKTMEPALSPDVRAALLAPTAAISSPWEMCLALAETAVENGAELFLETRVTGIGREKEGWTVYTSRGSYQSRFVINAAGVSAGEIHDMASSHSFTVRPSRGEYYLLDKSEGSRVNHVLFQCPNENGKGVLVAPTVHGNLIVGPSADAVVGNNTANSAAGMAFVREKALKSVPSVDFRQSIRNFAGVRARSDRGDFVIELSPDAPGFLDLAGICSPGLSAAPAIAEYAVKLLGSAGLPLAEKEDFLCERHRIRFKELPADQKAALIKKDPAYGRVVCRCETVTEGEILACFRAPIPPRSVDGVKRRVNAGMGRCQGGFCGPRVVELLSRELGVSPGDIVQDRADSRILLCRTKGDGEHV